MPDAMYSGLSDAEETSPPLNLLIVEDVPEDIELILLALESSGLVFAYETAADLRQCEAKLQRERFSAILADYRLPGLHAPQVLSVVQSLQPSTPFILVTGSLGEEAAVECIRAGMTDYVLKDRLYRLPTVLQRALNEADLRAQKQAAISQIEQQAWRESILNRIVHAMRETLVLEEVLQTTVNQLHDVLEVSDCLMVQPEADQRMVVRYVSDRAVHRTSFHNIECSLCQKHHQELWAGHQIVLTFPQTDLDPGLAQFFETHQIQSGLITPVCYQQRYFGVLTLYQAFRPRDWSEAERSLVKAVADQCAIAIYQSQLYEQAQKELQQRRRIEEQLRHDAFHDSLTGLPNRALFLDRLNHAIQIAHRHQDLDGSSSGREFAVLFLDLDDFRIVNDSLGHDAGDFLLRVVADRLNRCLRVGDTLARTSGDEFAILLEEIDGIDDITEIVDRIQLTLRRPITLDTQELFASACIGIVLNAHSYSDAAQFLRDADTAMYQAKGKGRGQYQVFDGSMHTQVKRRLQLENDLRRALDRQEFRLTYQPIIHLPTQHICGFEALIRWQDPNHGLLSPAHFIPIAEQTGLIVPIGQWVLHEACRQWQTWLAHWPEIKSMRMSVNLSAKQLAQPDLVEQIDHAIASTGMISQHLRVEITESALIETEETALVTLQQLRSRQIQVALDDFGTGYCSLSYLLWFPKDILKIDKSFVSNLETTPDNQEVIKTIIALGSNLGLEIVGEGIETGQQAEFLLKSGCLFGQGYWFYPPLEVVEVEHLLASQLRSPPEA